MPRLDWVVRDLFDGGAEVLGQFLIANCNGQGTGRAALALHPLTAEAVLTRPLDEALDEAGFEAAVHEFARYLAFWRDYAPRLVESRAAKALPGSPKTETMIRL